MLFYLRHWYKNDLKPRTLGLILKYIYRTKKITIGSNFKCDSIPDIFITGNGKIEIGDNVIFKRNVELRSHKNGKVKIGSNVKVDRGVRLLATNDATIDIYDNVYHIGLYSVFNAGESITIKSNSSISGYVYLQSSIHNNSNKSKTIIEQGYSHLPITLEEDVFVGAHSTILAGSNLKKGCVIGSNTVITRDIDENEIVMGVPVRRVSYRG
jgi:acetyltransferase-like isoleucine patch superfamily enzyme